MADDERVTRAGVYIERESSALMVTRAGVYIELNQNKVEVTHFGAYIDLTAQTGRKYGPAVQSM